ncbi:type II toxin-antitoxin system RelE/ParE family toxin [Ectothiorhodospiraceae bacterium BW-2]|nr:type II toxin-antitoxin system RelE/ParE family toxin [Ectothiorhodospiraceae bacterium BW-2]
MGQREAATLTMYSIQVHKQVKKYLLSLPKNYRQNIAEKMDLLAIDPYHHPQLDIKPMVGENDYYRLRVGQYRLIYRVENQKL